MIFLIAIWIRTRCAVAMRNVGDRQSGGFVASIKLFGFDENLMEIRGAVPLLGVSPL